MDRRQRALQAQGLAQFGQGHVRLALELLADGDAVLCHNELLAPGEVVPGLDAASFAPLLQQLFDHAQGDAKAPSDRIPCAFTFVISADNAFT